MSEKELSIKVNIANRVYPMKVKLSEEEAIRKAVNLINDRVKEYEQSYAVKDKQDLLAMCALQFATQTLNFEGKSLVDDQQFAARLAGLEELISDNL